MGKNTRNRRDEKHNELQREKKSNRGLRERLLALDKELIRIASENARLISENAEFKAIVSSGNVIPLKLKQGD